MLGVKDERLWLPVIMHVCEDNYSAYLCFSKLLLRQSREAIFSSAAAAEGCKGFYFFLLLIKLLKPEFNGQL